MRVLGINCMLKKGVTIRVLRKVLSIIKEDYPNDFDRLTSRITVIKSLSKKESLMGTLGEFKGVSNEGFYKKLYPDEVIFALPHCHPIYTEPDEVHSGELFIWEGIADEDELAFILAHELGHACTTKRDLARRKSPTDEWDSEATADWYTFKWGFKKLFRKYGRRNKDLLHHGPAPGEICELDGKIYLVSKNFVFKKLRDTLS